MSEPKDQEEILCKVWDGGCVLAKINFPNQGMEQRSFAVSTFSKTYVSCRERFVGILCNPLDGASGQLQTAVFFSHSHLT